MTRPYDAPPAFDGPPLGLTPILVVGDARAAIDFYVAAFGAAELARIAASDGVRLLHVRLRAFGSTLGVHGRFSRDARHGRQVPHAGGVGRHAGHAPPAGGRSAGRVGPGCRGRGDGGRPAGRLVPGRALRPPPRPVRARVDDRRDDRAVERRRDRAGGARIVPRVTAAGLTPPWAGPAGLADEWTRSTSASSAMTGPTSRRTRRSRSRRRRGQRRRVSRRNGSDWPRRGSDGTGRAIWAGSTRSGAFPPARTRPPLPSPLRVAARICRRRHSGTRRPRRA